MPRLAITILLAALALPLAASAQSTVAPTTGAKPKYIHPQLLSAQEAEFPDAARTQKLSGICLLRITVDVNGMPQNPRLRCTNTLFSQSALNAVAMYRFKPALDPETLSPVAVNITIEINFHLYNDETHIALSPEHFDNRILIAPADTPTSPDSFGVYPLTSEITAPEILKFADLDFGILGFMKPRTETSCIAWLTINAKGKPSNPLVDHCGLRAMEKPARASLLKSTFKPAQLHGKPVSVRAQIQLSMVELPLDPDPTPATVQP